MTECRTRMRLRSENDMARVPICAAQMTGTPRFAGLESRISRDRHHGLLGVGDADISCLHGSPDLRGHRPPAAGALVKTHLNELARNASGWGVLYKFRVGITRTMPPVDHRWRPRRRH